MENKVFNLRVSSCTYIVSALLICTGCELKTYLDYKPGEYPPKLSVTALLDSENSSMYISLMEWRSLADYAAAETFYYFFDFGKNHEGEIRLFEDGRLIRSKQGTFNTFTDASTYTASSYPVIQNVDYYELSGIDIKPGSIYRLEVELEGYPMATSTAVAPIAPVVSASMDTSIQVIRNHVREAYSMGYLWELGLAWKKLIDHTNDPYVLYPLTWQETLPDKYWPVSIRIADPDPDNMNYFALEICKSENTTDGTVSEIKHYNWGIGTFDASALLAYNLEYMLSGVEANDLFLFSILPTSDLDFSVESNLRTCYAGVVEIPNDNVSPYRDNPDFKEITTFHSLSLRVTHIPPAVYRYYRSLSLNKDAGMFSEPINVISNIENGYGIFSILNSTKVTLLEWETYEYSHKDTGNLKKLLLPYLSCTPMDQ